MTLFKKLMGIGTAALLTVGLAACSSDSTNANAEQDNSEKTVGESVDYEIIGIDPGSGLMNAAEKALVEYDLTDWDLISGASAAMTAALKRAYDQEKPIIVTGWTPHWKFLTFDLKILDDPKGVFGENENIHTVGRLGLKEDLPEAYAILERFKWEKEDMESIMIEIEEGVKPEIAAQNWIEQNPEKVAEWTDGIATVDGDEITLVYAPWDSEIASHNMMKIVLENVGYDVILSSVEPGPLFSSLASGGADVTLVATLPLTHETYMEKYEDQLEDIGIHTPNVRQGLIVPTYMEDVNSIEDLKN